MSSMVVVFSEYPPARKEKTASASFSATGLTAGAGSRIFVEI
jgi:hypothetical protein